MDKELTATSIVRKLRQAGFEAYFAGGCVRDKLRKVQPHDFDIATSATPEKIQAMFPKTVPVGVQFGVVLVVEDGEPFEVATFRTDNTYQDGRRPTSIAFTNVKEDALRRDFTVNGLYWDPIEQKLLDFVGGQEDLKNKIIRTIGDPEKRFLEDHLRMLRAIRFSIQLNFEIDPPTLNTINRHADLISKVSQERIRDEFCKIMTSEQPTKGIRQLDATGLLKHFLPEIETMKGVEQPAEYHPEGDVYIHTLMLLDGLKNAPVELAMGCLLHDIAKPQTFERAADRIRFHGHDKLGAEMAKKICRRLAFPNIQIELISALVSEHLRFKDVFQMRTSTLKRFLSLERFDLHMELHRLDCLASHKILDAYRFCQEKIEEFSKLPPPPMRLVTGQDLLQMGIPPGPSYSKLLRSVEDAILEGTVNSREQALDYLKEIVVKHS